MATIADFNQHMNTHQRSRRRAAGVVRGRRLRSLSQFGVWALLGMASILTLGADSAPSAQETTAPNGQSLEETRLRLGKWIETQQIISKERNEWQQGKEILLGRLDLVKKEIAALEEKIAQAESSVAEANAKREELMQENQELKDATTQLVDAVSAMEGDVRSLRVILPEPLKPKLEPLYQRIPEDSSKTRVSVAERFQNVLGILNELNKANGEITVNYEVRTMADGKPAEVRAFYVGLAQAYFVSARGEAGIGRPTATGWDWQTANSVSPDVLKSLEILQGKQSPAFVPLPVRIQ